MVTYSANRSSVAKAHTSASVVGRGVVVMASGVLAFVLYWKHRTTPIAPVASSRSDHRGLQGVRTIRCQSKCHSPNMRWVYAPRRKGGMFRSKHGPIVQVGGASIALIHNLTILSLQTATMQRIMQIADVADLRKGVPDVLHTFVARIPHQLEV
jgi:hypothetical protein